MVFYNALTSRGRFLLNIKPDGLTREEVGCLYRNIDDNPYDRGKREQTLKRLDVERRIALNEVEPAFSILKEALSASQVIENVIQKREERMSKWESAMSRGLISEDGLKFEKSEVERLQYQILAIKKNRKWLERVLGD